MNRESRLKVFKKEELQTIDGKQWKEAAPLLCDLLKFEHIENHPYGVDAPRMENNALALGKGISFSFKAKDVDTVRYGFVYMNSGFMSGETTISFIEVWNK